MKSKILCLIITLILVGTIPVMADSEFYVAYPENGSIISPSDSTFKVLSEIEADYVVIYLDGEEITKIQDDGEINYTLECEHYIGNHIVKAVAVKETDGVTSTYTAESNFTVALWENHEITNDDMSGAPTMNYFYYVGATGAKAEKVSGRTGDDDAAFAMMISEASDSAVSPYIWKNGINWTESMTIEMDLFFTDYATLTFETKSSAGFAFLFGDKVFGTGLSYNSPNFPANEWFKVKMEVDFAGLSSNMWIGRYDGEGNINYEKAFSNYIQSSNIAGTFQFKIQPRFSGGTPEGAYVGIDNFVINETKYTKGLDGLMYESNGEYISAGENTVAAGTEKIKFTNASRYTSSDITDKILIYEDGVKKNVQSAKIKDGVLEIVFKYPLLHGSEVDIILPDDILISGDVYRTKFSFNVSSDEFEITNVSLLSGSENIITAHQLSQKTDVLAKVTVSKLADSDKNVMLVLTCFENDRISSVEVVPVSFEESFTEIPVTLSGGDGISMEIYVIENFASSTPLTNIWSIK